MKNDIVLGEKLHWVIFAVKGIKSPSVIMGILNRAIPLIGMQKASIEPYICKYPTPGGGGGTGQTVVQPFLLAQPFVQSVALSDDYAEAFEWKGSTYVMIFSCLPVMDHIFRISEMIYDTYGSKVAVSVGSIIPP